LKKLSLSDLVSSAVILLLLSVIVHTTGLLTRVDNLIFDIGQKLQQSPAPSDVIIVAIDEISLSQIGRWPWSRATHAKIINRLHQEGAAAIGLDIVFAEPDKPEADQALAASIAQAKNVVLPVLLESTRVNGQIIETLPIPSLASAAADLGRVHAVLDEDGIARSIYLQEGLGAPVWQHFSQAVLNVAQHQASKNQFQLTSNKHFSLARDNQRRVNFLGPPGHFLSISYSQVLNGEFSQNLFKNKIVLVGATASGMNDLLTTPVSGLRQPMPGVEFHANVLESIRRHTLITPVSPAVSMLVSLLLVLLPLLWLPKLSALKGLLCTLFYFLLVGFLAAILPKLLALWLAPSAALLPILIAYPVWSWRKLDAAQKYLDYELNYLQNSLINAPVAAALSHRQYDNFDARIEQVRAASQQLRYLQDDKKDMLAFISHDIRAPLARAMMLLDGDAALQQKLLAALTQAHDLAEDFLHTSRAEMLDSASFKELDFASLTHQATDDAYAAAAKKNINLARDIVDGQLWVNGNFGLLQRALLNLILNAVKFSPEHSTITIKLKYANQQATFSVIDHGPGISAEEQTKLFKRFSRTSTGDFGTADSGTGKSSGGAKEGAGLGLYFVYTVAEKHHGNVSVESELGKMTSFNFSLPVQSFEV
jgi:CHASE2 domain-containing sensor protein